MKKFLLFALVAGSLVSASARLHAVAATPTSTPIPSFVNDGDPTGGNYILKDRKILGLGQYPGSIGGLTLRFQTVVNLGMGAPVVLAAVTYTSGVTQTATIGDKTIGGLVILPKNVTSVPAGANVDVVMRGMALGRVGQDITVGDALCYSATAGKLTKCAAVTEGIMTNISRTARVGVAAETKAVTAGDGYVKVLVGF